MGIPLLSKDHLLRQYLGPLKVLEVNTLIAEFKDEFVGIYHDGTTYLGEAFCIILRCVKKDFSIMLRLVKLAFLVGSMNNTQISAILQSGSPYNSPILFAPKPNSTKMRFCFDSRELNKVRGMG